MSEFPRLKTGAVAQYPIAREVRYLTQVFDFVDGGEQRFRDYDSALRTWTVQLTALDEEELDAIERFFLSEQGGYGTFTFTDPWDATDYDGCSIENPEVFFEFDGFHNGRTRLVVRQNR